VTFNDREDLSALLEDFEQLFARTRRPGVAAQYFEALKTFPLATVAEAARDLKLKVTRFPTIAEWFTECKAAAGRRARATPPPSVQPDAPATWGTTANLVLTFAALVGVRVGHEATRARALELVHDELRAGLREEFNSPAEVPRARLVDERRRIVGVLVRELAATGAERAS
jgi:hypothetical protein